MAEIEQRMTQLREGQDEDVATGMKEGMAYVQHSNCQIQELRKRKAAL